MKPIFIRISLLATLSFLLLACQKDIDVEIFDQAKTTIDESYGDHARQTMDIHLPAHRSSETTKVIILLHGGSWIQGDKSEMDAFIPSLTEKLGSNFALVNMNYRFVNFVEPRYMLPTQTDDINSVINYIDDKHLALGVKPEFIVMGYSAGAHLAMLYAYNYDSKNRVKLVVNAFGPTDLSDSFYKTNPLFIMGLNYIVEQSNLPAGYTATEFASPVTWVSNRSQPTISFYGTNDEIVPSSQKNQLEEKFKQNNIPYETYIFEGGHNAGAINYLELISKTSAFINNHYPN